MLLKRNPMAKEQWMCPWCQQLATRETKGTLCESRTCDCGAIALSAPVADSDEIIDDAIGLFNVQIREESRGFNDLILADIALSGVDVRGGALKGTPLPTHRSIWFKRLATGKDNTT